MISSSSAVSGESPSRRSALTAVNVTKRFPGVTANDGVNFDVEVGQVHTLLGENGAGKSSLASLLCGLYKPDEGHIKIRGKTVSLKNPRQGLGHGIGMVHQHFRLVERFTVAENILLGDPKLSRLLKPAEMCEQVAAVSEQFGLALDPKALVSDLSIGERQRVEIVKMLYRGANVLLLDEPTAVLASNEVDELFETVKEMVSNGRSVVFISHKLDEVMAISDKITVMRAGKVTGEVATSKTNQKELAELMVGRPITSVTKRGSHKADLVLSAQKLGLARNGRQTVQNVDLDVHEGEIVGVAGVAGNGQRPLAEMLAGVIKPSSGRVKIAGQDVTGKGPTKAREAGLVFVPEDRLGTGLVPNLSLTDNMLLTKKRRFFLDRKVAAQQVEKAIEEYNVKARGPASNASLLSGGNAQKILLARELAGVGQLDSPQVAIVSSPTRGLDIGAVEFVQDLLHNARENGAGILLISEDLDEVISLADRLVVLYQGQIVLEGLTDELDRNEIGLAMGGAGNISVTA